MRGRREGLDEREMSKGGSWVVAEETKVAMGIGTENGTGDVKVRMLLLLMMKMSSRKENTTIEKRHAGQVVGSKGLERVQCGKNEERSCEGEDHFECDGEGLDERGSRALMLSEEGGKEMEMEKHSGL